MYNSKTLIYLYNITRILHKHRDNFSKACNVNVIKENSANDQVYRRKSSQTFFLTSGLCNVNWFVEQT